MNEIDINNMDKGQYIKHMIGLQDRIAELEKLVKATETETETEKLKAEVERLKAEKKEPKRGFLADLWHIKEDF